MNCLFTLSFFCLHRGFFFFVLFIYLFFYSKFRFVFNRMSETKPTAARGWKSKYDCAFRITHTSLSSMLVTNKLPVHVFIESAESSDVTGLSSAVYCVTGDRWARPGRELRPLLPQRTPTALRRPQIWWNSHVGWHMKGELNIKPDKIYFSVCFQDREKQNMSEITLIIVLKSSNQK